MNDASSKRLSLVYPGLARRVRALDLVLSKRGIVVVVTQGLRSYAEQNLLFAQGRTRSGDIVTNATGGHSKHNFGIAVDLAPLSQQSGPGGSNKIDWKNLNAFIIIGEQGKKLGLLWGGDWTKLIDKPHLELPSPPLKDLRNLMTKGGLAAVWAKMDLMDARTPSV